MCCVVVVVVVRSRPRVIPLAMITMRKAVDGFLRLWGSAWRPFGPLELRYLTIRHQPHFFSAGFRSFQVVPCFSNFPVPLLDEFNRNKGTETSKNERITKTNQRSMKYRNTDNGIISTFVKLSFLSMSVMRQI